MAITYRMLDPRSHTARGRDKSIAFKPGTPVMVTADDGRSKDGPRPVAYLLRNTAGGGPNAYLPGAREILLYGDDQCREVLATVTTEHGTGFGFGGPRFVYRVLDPDGTLIGRISLRRGRIFRIGRSHWTMDQAGTPPVRGSAGRLMWWALWWTVLLPLNIALVVAAFTGIAQDPVTTPRRIVWRDSAGRAVMSFRGLAGDYRVMQDHWDPRMVASLVAIHQTYVSIAISDSTDWYHR
ncbi:hypothetical protein [Streptomyces sp. ISL-100]|uniref:hypothetical protein n=1 Tax=Streptomyces sp. ISL-100 TaxID=2819173 RepID=UPI001BEC7194|nr:hypothetical protein [Streptomyces sp. ISL-100]MBT2396638.1 hypothetical protein [Streptomyces sp. ISL-100]